MIDNPKKAYEMGMTARKTAKSLLDVNIIAQQHLDAYKTVLN